MKPRFLFAICLLGLAGTLCFLSKAQSNYAITFEPQVTRCHVERYDTADLRTQAKSSPVNWQSISPVELVDLLIKKRAAGETVFPAYAIHYRWIQEADIPLLMNLINSTQKCCVVTMPLTSGLPPADSTVGVEVRHLIIGYWKGYYPVEADSGKITVTTNEIISWYRVWRRQFDASELNY